MSIEQRDLCESTCKTLWRSVCKTLEQRELCESTFKTFWRSVCKTWEHRACNIGETKYLQQDKREVDMNACYRKRTYRRYCPPNQPRAKTRERSTWMLAKQDQIWATPPTQIVSQYFLVLQSLYTERFYTEKFLHRGAFTHRDFYFYTKNRSITHRSFTHRSCYTQKFLRTDAFTPKWVYTAQKSSLFILQEKLLHRASFYTNIYTDKFLHRSLLLQASFYTEKLLHRASFHIRNGNRNCSSETGSRHQSQKRTILKHFFEWILKEKWSAPKLRKRMLQNHHRNLDAATPIRIATLSCKGQ